MPDQALLVATLVELADNLVDDFDVVDLLGLLTDRCVTALDVTAAGVMLAAPGGQLQVLASSSEAMHTLELFQLQADQGPCIDAYQTGEPIVNIDLGAAGSPWPNFAAAATDGGFRSAHCLPLRLRGQTIGALNLLRSQPGQLGETELTAARALADISTIAIIQNQLVVDARTLNDQLAAALQSRVVIEQAKGKVSEGTGADMDLAFRRIRNHARNHNQLLADVAQKVATGAIGVDSLDPLPRTR